jgi:hypothetical protein
MKTPIVAHIAMAIAPALALALVASPVGCSPAAETRWTSSSEPSSTTAAALGAVQNCTAQAQACASTATTPSAIASCEQGLKACLDALVAEAGVPTLPPFDAGFPLPSLDGSFLPPLPDGSLPTLPEAGLPPLPNLPDAAAVDACLQTLQSCLGSSTDPTTCATQVTTCLQQAL